MKYLIIFLSLFAFMPIANAQTLDQSIEVSPSPMKIAVVGDTLYTSSFEFPHISIVNLVNGEQREFITTTEAGIMDIEVVPEKDKVYATIYGTSAVDVYFLNMTFDKQIELPHSQITFEAPPSDQLTMDLDFETGGWAITHNEKLDTVYVADYRSDLVYVIDSDADEVIESIEVPAHPYEMAIDENTNVLVVTSTAGNSVSFIRPLLNDSGELAGHELVKSILVQEAPWGVEIDSEEHIAYVTNRGSEAITTFSTTPFNPSYLSTIPLDYTGQAIAIDSVNNILYVGYQYENQLVTIDLDTGERTYSLTTESYPWALTFDEESNKLYAALKDANKIAVFDTQYGQQTEPTTYYWAKSSLNTFDSSANFWTILWNDNRLIHTLGDEMAVIEFEITEMCPQTNDMLCFTAEVNEVSNSEVYETGDTLKVSISDTVQKITRINTDGVTEVLDLALEDFHRIDGNY